MAHELEMLADGTASMAYAGELPGTVSVRRYRMT